jgi:hypothetical protein
MDPIIQLLPELADGLEQQCNEQQQLEYTTKNHKVTVESVTSPLFSQKLTTKLKGSLHFVSTCIS